MNKTSKVSQIYIQSKMYNLAAIFAILGVASAYRPLQSQTIVRYPKSNAGEALYLTPYIESGRIAEGRNLSRVVAPLDGLPANQVVESYSGFLTVNKNTDSNIFFWFFPATEVDHLDAPVVIWLQGGPGGSSLFGLLEIHGPYQAVFNGSDVVATFNPHHWAKKANIIYIDNPVGAGFSYCENVFCLPSSQSDVAVDLYEALIQWFKLFPEYQGNDFYPFGESYGGKFVPTIAKKIHDENPSAKIKINLVGMGIGDGFMSPPDSSIYADFLYYASLVDEVTRDELIVMEKRMQSYCAAGSWENAFYAWNNEFGTFLDAMGCYYYYGFDICDTPVEEDNYADFVNAESSRVALHVGNIPFGAQSGSVYSSMINDFMRSERETIEFLLERYQVLIYNGNFDIICNHPGVLKMFEAMENWSGKDKFFSITQKPYPSSGPTFGYLKSVDNLRLFVMRNSGHMVPRSEPESSLIMYENFISGRL